MKRPDGTWDQFDDYVIDFALERLRAGERVALVTLIHIEGSSPRPLGAQMAVSQAGDSVGYLSGGCIERAIVSEALAAMVEGRGRRVRYGRGSKYLDIQLPCGSAIELVFDVDVREDDLAHVHTCMLSREPTSLCIPSFVERAAADEMTRQYYPRRKLIIAGVGPAAVLLARLGQLAGFQTVLHSPDKTTLGAVRTEGVATIAINSASSIPSFKADARSAIVFMFHDHEWERTLIPVALDTPAFYIGAMGSRRTHKLRLEMLQQLGVEQTRAGRIRGPAGLFSGAKSAPDVAMSIVAEFMQIERGSNIENLSCLDGPLIIAGRTWLV